MLETISKVDFLNKYLYFLETPPL